MNISESLAVQSYCFRHFKDNAEVADKVKAIGLSRIERPVTCSRTAPWPFKEVARQFGFADQYHLLQVL